MRSLLLILFLAGALLGCARPTLSTELPDDGAPIPVTRDAALNFISKSAQAGQGAATEGAISWTVTQEEVTSFIAIGADLAELVQLQGRMGQLTPAEQERVQEIMTRLEIDSAQLDALMAQLRQEQEQAGFAGLPVPDLSLRLALREPQVYFKGDGRVIVRGFGEVRGRRQPVRLVMQPRAASGELELDFVEGVIGPVPVPEALVDTVGRGVASAILMGKRYAEITELRVEEGRMTFSGRRN